MAAVVSRDDELVIKSPNDQRSYRLLRLANGLCALLVHDPEIYADGYPDPKATQPQEDKDMGDEEEDEGDEEDDDDGEEYSDEEGDDDEDEGEDEEEEEDGSEPKRRKEKGGAETLVKKAAAAMCVGMGSFADPPKAQGLAHFLEHMLFMGSSEFPDENEYDSYLSKHGGASNAFTETEYTCYHFEVKREYLKGALDRFSQFFVSPLVKAEAMDREILAVDSEFNQVRQSDSCRLYQLQSHTCSQGHPLNRFTWGNKKSLVDAMGSGINLREEILQMYMKNYHGGAMKLVIIGGEPLDILESWTMELFSKVKAGPLLDISPKTDMPFWKSGKLHKLEAVRDVHSLCLSWTLPCLHKEYMKKPEDYLAHLLGHEGKGSLLYFLKAKGWASSLSAGVGSGGSQRSSYAYIFEMSVHLTDSGLKNVFEVIGAVYQYIKLLKQSDPQEWIFKELQDIGYMEFRFAEEQPPDDYAVDLAENMLFYSEKHVVCGEYIYEDWDPALVKHALSFFNPDNMRVDILSKSFDKQSQAIQCEPWFGSQYIEEDIPSSLIESWRNPVQIDANLHLPRKNEFIPGDFTLRNANAPRSSSDDNLRCIVDEPFIKLWYKMDMTFNVPRANTYFLIFVKDGCSSLENSVLTDLFINLLKDELNEVLYQAYVAKLETSLSVVGSKLEFKLYGYNDKLAILLSNILSACQSFSPKTDRFEVIKEDLERAYKNTNMKPMNHSTYLRLQVLREIFWDVDEKLEVLMKLTFSDLVGFAPKLLSQLHIEGLCHGNLSEEEAMNISKIFRNTLSAQTLSEEARHGERVICIPNGANFVRSVRVKNDLEENSVVEVYFPIEQDIGKDATRLRAIIDLFSSIIEEPCFDQLRTKEQLGYTVDSSPRMTYRMLAYCFRVMSSKYSPVYLQSRIDNFINGLSALLDGLDEETFEHHRSGLIADKLEKDPSLSYQTGDYWSQIVDKRYMFDMSKLEAEELRTVWKDDIIAWYNTYIRSSSPKRRRLAVHVYGCNSDIAEAAKLQEQSWTIIDDVKSLKVSSQFYSSLC
ncbi:nardilysin-like [Phragmites australis]|uniref:nardilysin-like n=1 Tax=Phragmites australis TaxID=29695 RepID=UPI002D79221D|nr:nardilysin-like [Phragmites australis]